MSVVVFSRTLSKEAADQLNVAAASSLLDLAARSNVLSIHVPLTPKTYGMINRPVFRSLPTEALVINTARAEVIDYEALIWAINKRGIRLGLDVHYDEPQQTRATFRSDLLSLPSVYGTPHIGGRTSESQLAIGREIVRIVEDYCKNC